MTFVIDASVAIKWVVEEADRDRARLFLDTDEDLHAPDLLAIEVGNALCRKLVSHEISAMQAKSGLADVMRLFDVLAPSSPLVSRAMDFAVEMQHPIYDCIYLAYAESIGAPFVTDDRRLASKSRAANLAISVQLLADTSPSAPR